MNHKTAVVPLASLFAAFLLCAQLQNLARVNLAKLKKGEDLFVRRCTGCHRLDKVRVGPPLRNVFGRPAGSDAGFPYSAGLKSLRLKWDEATLDKWLTDPEALAPDTDMAFRLSSAEERGAIIAYLRNLHVK
ncbi:MAG TPA: c-type cytochrome [Bryobacteraceae bacterium]|jgi:cytochrome c